MSNPPSAVSLWAGLADRESRLLALLRTAVQIIWMTDAQGRAEPGEEPPGLSDLTWHNFTGQPRVETFGDGWLNAIHPEDVPALLAAREKAIKDGGDFHTEFRVRHRSGEWRSMACHGQALRDEHGKLIGWFGTCTDVSDIRRAEAAHREAEIRLRAALDAGEMATWIWQASDETFYWDATGGRLWGVDPDGPRSANLVSLQQFVHPDDRAATVRAAMATAGTGEFHSVEFRVARADGRLQWLQTRGRVEKDADGKVVRVIGVFVDVTKLKTAEESLRQSQKLQALGTLAGGIAHDFNNLVLIIGGNAQLALSDLTPEHPAHTSLEQIANAAARASNLVRRILTFAARRPHAPTVTPIQPAVRDALKLIASAAPPNVTIEPVFSDNGASCTLGQTELEQIVVNLVTNAIHAIGERPGNVEVIVDLPEASDTPTALRRDTTYVRLSIRDDGEGMTREIRSRIFEPFFTTKPRDKGTGLGLAVVHGIVSAAGGAILVDSEPGRGTTFQVWLPCATAVEASDSHAVSAAPRDGSGEHILYVDDDEPVGHLICRTLERAGYRVSCHTDPHAALEFFRRHADNVDVVVTDLTMPVMNGFGLVAALREVRPDIPVVMTSGYAREEDQRRADQLSIGPIVPKPDTPEELARVIEARCAALRT